LSTGYQFARHAVANRSQQGFSDVHLCMLRARHGFYPREVHDSAGVMPCDVIQERLASVQTSCQPRLSSPIFRRPCSEALHDHQWRAVTRRRRAASGASYEESLRHKVCWMPTHNNSLMYLYSIPSRVSQSTFSVIRGGEWQHIDSPGGACAAHFHNRRVLNPSCDRPARRIPGATCLKAHREREKSSPRSCGREQLPRIDLRNLGLFTALG
jgi:hypothetical protein